MPTGLPRSRVTVSASPAPLILLTGERGIGKSTVCSTLRDFVARRGVRCGGFLTRRDLDDAGATCGLSLEEAATGACHRLAATREELRGPRVGPFSMDAAMLALGVQLARSAFDANLDLVFLDEIGPLELVQGLGFAPAIPLVAAHPRAAVILTLRPTLVVAAASRLAPRVARVEIVTQETRDVLPRRLGEEILAALPR
jgi:nucleoside-triphosphatase THEP1